MSEHGRSVDLAGTTLQWFDAEMVMILDRITGEPKRFGPEYRAIGHLEDALECMKAPSGGAPRYVIVRLQCIVAQKL